MANVTSSQHRNPPLNVRPDKDAREKAEPVLDGAGWTVSDFISACFNAVAANPRAFLAALAPHRPPPAKWGRPRKMPKSEAEPPPAPAKQPGVTRVTETRVNPKR